MTHEVTFSSLIYGVAFYDFINKGTFHSFPLRLHYKGRRVALLPLLNYSCSYPHTIVISAHALKYFKQNYIYYLPGSMTHKLTMQIYKLDKPHSAFQNLENGYYRFLNNRSDISTSADFSSVITNSHLSCA